MTPIFLIKIKVTHHFFEIIRNAVTQKQFNTANGLIFTPL